MRLNKLLLMVFLMSIGMQLSAQKYFTKEGNISFSSDAPMEKIEAFNKNATSVLDTENGNIEFAVLIKSFHFDKALMQEHFNENYMESGKYPKSTFKGEIGDISSVDMTKDGDYPVKVKGALTIHGETNDVVADGVMTVANGALSAKSTFVVAVADYGIKIPKVVRENIAKEVEILVDLTFQPLNK